MIEFYHEKIETGKQPYKMPCPVITSTGPFHLPTWSVVTCWAPATCQVVSIPSIEDRAVHRLMLPVSSWTLGFPGKIIIGIISVTVNGMTVWASGREYVIET